MKTFVGLVLTLVWFLIAFTLAIIFTEVQPIHQPGVLYKLPLSSIPELLAIYTRFQEMCTAPLVAPRYHMDSKSNPMYQTIRKEASQLSKTNEAKYTLFETEPKIKSEWVLDVRGFYSNIYTLNPSDQSLVDADWVLQNKPKDYERECTAKRRNVNFVPKLGYFQRDVEEDFELFALEQIKQCMTRMNIPIGSRRVIGDARTLLFVPSGGFVEMHANQKRFSGWRLEFQWVSKPKSSYFYYRHPLDSSLRIVQHRNNWAHLYRVRRAPQRLLWQSIVSDQECFQWGMTLPCELGRALRPFGVPL